MSGQLQRFVDAQDRIYNQARDELRSGQKRSHWMWFIFPQLDGLGHSTMARRYAITGRSQAVAYLDHPVLGQRLRECVGLVTAHTELTPQQILGSPDYLKLQSSLTLFHLVVPDDTMFSHALEQLYGGKVDPMTVQLLQRAP